MSNETQKKEKVNFMDTAIKENPSILVDVGQPISSTDSRTYRYTSIPITPFGETPKKGEWNTGFKTVLIAECYNEEVYYAYQVALDERKLAADKDKYNKCKANGGFLPQAEKSIGATAAKITAAVSTKIMENAQMLFAMVNTPTPIIIPQLGRAGTSVEEYYNWLNGTL